MAEKLEIYVCELCGLIVEVLDGGAGDLVCCGHDHVADIRSVGNLSGGETMLANPGTVGGIKAPATWILGDLETMQFEIREVVLPQEQAAAGV